MKTFLSRVRFGFDLFLIEFCTFNYVNCSVLLLLFFSLEVIFKRMSILTLQITRDGSQRLNLTLPFFLLIFSVIQWNIAKTNQTY